MFDCNPPPTVACARRAVEAWCEGGDALQPILELPEASRSIARAIARTQCEMIRWYGQRVIAGGMLDAVPDKWQQMVARYVFTRSQRS